MAGGGLILILLAGWALLFACVAAVVKLARWVRIRRAAAFDRHNREAIERELAGMYPVLRSERRRMRDMRESGL